MSEYFGGTEALAAGLANQEQLRRNAIRKLEAEGKIEKGSLEREMASIEHDGEAGKNKEMGKVEETGKEHQGPRHVGKSSNEGTTVYEAPPTYTSEDHGSTSDPNASTGMKSAIRRFGQKYLNR